MPYTPTEWSRGDVVTSEKLNKLEQGVAEAGGGSGGGLVVNAVDHEESAKEILDQTYNTIHNAMLDGKAVSIRVIKNQGTAYESDTIYTVEYVVSESGAYQVNTYMNTYQANDPDGYPDYYYGD